MDTRVERKLSIELIPELKGLKDVKTLDDLDFGNLELTRGDTPDDIKQTCLQLCADYLGDKWTQQTVDTIEFRRLAGGLTNQLYYCAIGKPSVASDEPQEVVIRIYGPKHFNNKDHGGNERLTDVINTLLVSEKKLGPKVYGLFESGQILGYYKHRQFRLEEQSKPELVAQVFKKLAQIHAMKVPIKMSHNWLFDDYERFYRMGYEKFPINDMIAELNLQTFKKHDLKAELQWLKEAVAESGSPAVFSHHDFRGSNIMVTEPDDEILFCDLEYSAYGWRGFDFGTILVEWGRTFSEFGKSEKDIQKYPNDETIKGLLKIYVEESIRLLGPKFANNPVNSIDHILREAKLFSLAAIMFLVVFSIKNDVSDGISLPIDKKLFMQWGENAYEGYFYMKEMFGFQ